MGRFWQYSFIFLWVIWGGVAFPGTGRAALNADGLRPVDESPSFQDYLKKPPSNLSQLIFALDYFRNEPVMVRFDDVDYPILFAYPLGLVYLLTYYKNEAPEAWIKKNCYRSPTANKIMYFKYPDGSYRQVRETALQLLQELEVAQEKALNDHQSEERTL